MSEQWTEIGVPPGSIELHVLSDAQVEAIRAAAWQQGCDAGWAAAHDVVTCIDGSKNHAPRPTNPYRAALRAVSSEAPA